MIHTTNDGGNPVGGNGYPGRAVMLFGIILSTDSLKNLPPEFSWHIVGWPS